MNDNELVEKVARALQACVWPPVGYHGTLARAALAAVDLPAVRAEAERAGAAKALREAADEAEKWEQDDLEEWLLQRAAEVESGVTAQERCGTCGGELPPLPVRCPSGDTYCAPGDPS